MASASYNERVGQDIVRSVGGMCVASCELVCKGCGKNNVSRVKTENGTPVSKDECYLAHKLDSLGIEFKLHETETGCAFNKNDEREYDFYLPKYDLYIEVKGWMSSYEHNRLRWLVEKSGKYVYVYVVDNEDWDGLCSGIASRKKEDVREKQLQELRALSEGNVSAENLAELSRLRLEEYRLTRKGDMIRWGKAAIERKYQLN